MRRQITRRFDKATGIVVEETERDDWRALLVSQTFRAALGAGAGIAVAPSDETRLAYALTIGLAASVGPDALLAVGESRLPDIALAVIDKVGSIIIAARQPALVLSMETQAGADLLPSHWHWAAQNAKRMLRLTFEWRNDASKDQSLMPWAWRNCQAVIDNRYTGVSRQKAWQRAVQLWCDAGIIADRKATQLAITRLEDGYSKLYNALTPHCYLINGIWYDR